MIDDDDYDLIISKYRRAFSRYVCRSILPSVFYIICCMAAVMAFYRIDFLKELWTIMKDDGTAVVLPLFFGIMLSCMLLFGLPGVMLHIKMFRHKIELLEIRRGVTVRADTVAEVVPEFTEYYDGDGVRRTHVKRCVKCSRSGLVAMPVERFAVYREGTAVFVMTFDGLPDVDCVAWHDYA